jgi:hypothetical protein
VREIGESAEVRPMMKALKIIGVVVALALMTVVGDWYRFITYAELDPKRGVYGNSHLEVWIDINRYMPEPMRAWGCRTLLTREAAVMGVPYQENRRTAPLGCNPPRDNMPFEQAFFGAFIANADLELKRRKATQAQRDGAIACLRDGLIAKVTPAQMDAMKSGRDQATMIAVSETARTLTTECVAKAGL